MPTETRRLPTTQPGVTLTPLLAGHPAGDAPEGPCAPGPWAFPAWSQDEHQGRGEAACSRDRLPTPSAQKPAPRTSYCLPFLHNLWTFVSFLLLSHLYLASVEQSVLLRVGRFDLKVQQMGLRR